MRMLTWLAAGSTAAVVLVAATAPGWPWWAVLSSAGIAGLAVTSWNGVYLAELVMSRRRGRIPATAGASLLTFVGYVLGPDAFGMIVDHAESYRIAFGLAALLPASAVIAGQARPLAPA